MMIKTKMTVAAFAVLALGAAACDRGDKPSTTNTTSADTPAPNDPSTLTPVPLDQTLDSKDGGITETTSSPMMRRPSMGPSQAPGVDGINNRGSMSNSGTPVPGDNAAGAPASTLNTPPGHIMFPPDKRPLPNDGPTSNGTHDMGASGPVDRR